ncbi:YbdK family carboxylate-amine ligase [Propionivibrio limicola]|uniref:YbdK family carboxylate-amine ligase n=1 Tax=Propionivibrio limicola TaxID=167645 RepID=UPI001B883D87|nr:YbdK family carboxylate-amine ligase [Propionivibrio limicola]
MSEVKTTEGAGKELLVFTESAALTLGVELEMQLLSPRDFDLTRGATDLLSILDYDNRFGDIKLEITESMIEVGTLPRHSVDEIGADLDGLRQVLVKECARNNIVICGGGTHPFHRWPERRISPGERYAQTFNRYGYLAKQFTVFGQHIHVGCASADDAIWLTQALCPFVPFFIALSASSPFVDGVDTFFQSARLNAVSAFPLSGQCPELRDWAHFNEYYALLKDCGIIRSIKDLYWDVRPKPEYGTVEIRVCDTPLGVTQAAALAAFAQCLARHLLRTRPPYNAHLHLHVARYNKFQACRYGLDALLSSPVKRGQEPLREVLSDLLDSLVEDAVALGCSHWLESLRAPLDGTPSDADWLRERYARQRNLNDVVRESSIRFAQEALMPIKEAKQ